MLSGLPWAPAQGSRTFSHTQPIFAVAPPGPGSSDPAAPTAPPVCAPRPPAGPPAGTAPSPPDP
eukprot:2973534-Pyramimonas_sp.AAC.1